MTFPLKSRSVLSLKTKLLITVSSSFAVACSQSILTGGTRKAGKPQTPTTDHQLATPTSLDQLTSVADLSELKFEEFSGVSTLDFYQKALADASNDPIDVLGHQFSGLKDYLVDQESVFLTIADKYPTLADYFNDLNITSEADIKPEDVEAGYGVLEQILNTGVTAESIESDATVLASGGVGDQFSLSNAVRGRTGLSLNDDQSAIAENAAMAAAAPGSFPSDAGAMGLADKRRKKNSEPTPEPAPADPHNCPDGTTWDGQGCSYA